MSHGTCPLLWWGEVNEMLEECLACREWTRTLRPCCTVLWLPINKQEEALGPDESEQSQENQYPQPHTMNPGGNVRLWGLKSVFLSSQT